MSDIEHQKHLLAIHRGNAQHYLNVIAQNGSLAPIGAINGLASERARIYQIKQALREYYHITDVDDIPGLDYDIEEQVQIKIDKSLYLRIREIVEKYGIQLPNID